MTVSSFGEDVSQPLSKDDVAALGQALGQQQTQERKNGAVAGRDAAVGVGDAALDRGLVDFDKEVRGRGDLKLEIRLTPADRDGVHGEGQVPGRGDRGQEQYGAQAQLELDRAVAAPLRAAPDQGGQA